MTEMGTGDELALTVGRLRLGIGWDKERTAGAIGTGAPDIDLDATALQFAAGKLFDLAFYNNLTTRDGSVVHLGDNQTGTGDGDDESITVDLGRVHGPVDTILLIVSSYQGHSLTWLNNGYCRVVDLDTGSDVAWYRLSGGPDATGLVMAKLVRAGAGWVFRTVGEGVAITKPTEGLAKLNRFV
jgi:tellurium resistance protein TerZ